MVSAVNARLLAALILFTGACERAWPQSPVPDFRGELNVGPGKIIYGYTVNLFDLSSQLETVHADVDMGGNFTLHGAAPGEYAVRVRDSSGEVVSEEYLTLSSRPGPLLLRVNTPETSKPPAGTVSLKQLQHPPSPKAVRAFRDAARFSEAGKYPQAAQELEKAVRLSPDFAQAHTNLAVQHFRLGRYEEAAGEARRAMDLAGSNPQDLCNLALALWALHRLPEALDAGEKALALNSGFVHAQFVVGSILAMDPRTRVTGIRYLKLAAPTMPAAVACLERLRQAGVANR